MSQRLTTFLKPFLKPNLITACYLSSLAIQRFFFISVFIQNTKQKAAIYEQGYLGNKFSIMYINNKFDKFFFPSNKADDFINKK